MPRGGFSAALIQCGVDAKAAKDVPLNVQEQAELQWLRNRVVTLEAQLRMNGIVPVVASTPPAGQETPSIEYKMEDRLVHFLEECGLEQYSELLARQGYSDMYTVLAMQESHMRNLGMSAGHALKFSMKIQERKANGGEDGSSEPVASPWVQYRPGIYRCVHGPRVAIRAAPSRTSPTLETLRPGDLIRISEVVPPCWGKVDDSEIWARFTAVWPRKPRIVRPLGEDGEIMEGDEDEDEETSMAPPQHAFVLIDGKEAGIDGPLIKRITLEEANEAVWPFRDALEVRCAELDASTLRRQPHARESLRRKFVDTAKGYVGVPYARCYHDPSDTRCLPGSTLLDSSCFLDDKQLVIRVVDDLKVDFGFVLDLTASCSHLYHLLAQHELKDEKSLEPGDLIFYEIYNRKSRRSRIVHVEIFVGGKSGSESVGSLPWSANMRTGKKDGVQVFDSYDLEVFEGEKIVSVRCCSIRPWLESGDCSFAHGQFVRQLNAERD